VQQKNLKYILLLGVAAVWGIIIYRIIDGVGNDSPSPKLSFQPASFKVKDSTDQQPYTLLLDYVDPFGAEEETASTNNLADLDNEKGKGSGMNYTKPAKPDVSFIKYKGMITNSVTHKKAAIISINGKDELARPGKTINNIKINQIKKDEVLVTYSGESYWIKRQSN
jgi:hypothetical protein